MKRNVTLKLDADLLREAKVLAAKQGTSLSGMVSEHLEEIVRRELAYENAKARALRRLEEGLDLQWSPPASREELHGRSRLR